MKMQIGMLVSFFCILALYKVQAKAVKSSNHMSFTGPYPLSSQFISISDQESAGIQEEFKTSVPSMVGKPLYFRHDSSYKSELPSNGNYEKTSTDRLELSNYENLERMFDRVLEFPKEHKFEDPKIKIDTSYSSYEKEKKKVNKKGDVLMEDQVFLHQNTEKRVKKPDGGSMKLHIESPKKKTSNVGPPCTNTDINDYHNSSNEDSSVDNKFNIHGAKYKHPYERSQSNVYMTPSKDFQQHQTKIIHENMNLDRTESDAASDKLEEYFEGNVEKKEYIEKKLKKSNTEHTNNIDLDVPEKEIPSNKQHANSHNPITSIHQDLETRTLEISSKPVVEDKQVSNLEPMFGSNFKSFVFNPNAEPQEVFQECKTPKNESGFCRYIQHCMLPSIIGSIRHFMDNVCIIQEQYIGVCCPEFPVQSVLVTWPDRQGDLSSEDDNVEVPEDCGVGTNKRIIGGLDADRKAWPWMVALLNSRKKFFCGGSLINNRYVLTAAHCTFGPSNNRIIARLGEYDFNDPREPHDDYLVAEIKRHGQYARFTLQNDIAVLKLERPVVFNEFVRTICLPEPGKDYLGKSVTLAGWGHLNGASSSTRSDILQEASFPIIGNDECSKSHGVPVASSIICAAAPEKDKGACNGDSGGPLMLLDSDERWKVVGIVSWGRRGCNPKFPTAYSRVTHYLDWIKEHTTMISNKQSDEKNTS